MTALEKRIITYNTILSINDPSNDFIPYWNLAMKENLNNNFITIDSDSKKSGTIPLTSFNFKLIDIKEKSNQENVETIQLNEIATIDVYRIKKEKDFNADFIKALKQNYNVNNINIMLYNVEDVKDNIIKNFNKTIDKIRSKTGLVDLSVIPYNDQNYNKFYSIFDTFFINLKKKIATEYNNQIIALLNKINDMKDIYNSTDPELTYEYIKNRILYLDLLIIGEFWEDIKAVCIKDLFKVFAQLKNKFTFTDCSSEINELEIKKNVKNKNITNIEYQIFLINCYMKSCRHLKTYDDLINSLFDSSRKFSIYKDSFESEYHYYYWIVNYILNLANYLITFEEKIPIMDIESKNCIKQGIIFLYSICINYLKQYSKLFKYEIPSIKIFISLKNLVDKGLNIKDELEKDFANNNFDEKSEIFNKFKTDVKSINTFYFDLNKNIFDVFTNKKCFLEEYLHILQIMNKNTCEITNHKNSIRNFFEIIPILISLNKFEEAKNILNNILDDKIFIKTKLNTIYEFLCLLLIILLYSSEKNSDNLKLMFKLLDTTFTNVKFYLSKLECKDENLINDIISKFIESYSNIDNKQDANDILNKKFSLDKAINITLERKKDEIIFINKQKTNKEQIKYTLTNNTGVNFNINKVQLIFEEFSFTNANNKDKDKEKKEIIYEINDDTNSLKCIEPYAKSKENMFEIILDEKNDIFKINTTYKFIQIKYIINNTLCGIYNIKENIKLCFNTIEMKVSTNIYPSYDSSEFSSTTRDVFYFNTLSNINMDLTELPDNDLLNNKTLRITFEDLNKKSDIKLIIQTYLLQEELAKEYKDIKINDFSIEFTADSLKEKSKDKLNLKIPFYVENINFYDNGSISMKIKVEIIESNPEDKNNDKIYYSFTSFHNINLTHLFNIRKKFRLIPKNSILMQTTFSLNIEATNVIVYTHNSENFSFYMDTTQAINLVLLYQNKEEEIIKKLRQNFLEFSLDDIINNEKKIVKYRLCYPEKNILDEIKELKEIPYYININVDEKSNDIYKELNVNINIKKNNNKKVILLIHISDNENWAVIGKTKFIEEWFDDKDDNEKNMKIKLLPLVDGFVKLPEIEFLEYEISENNDDILKINEEENKGEFTIGKMNFEPIEYGTLIEGNEKVVNITPAKECALKLNLT